MEQLAFLRSIRQTCRIYTMRPIRCIDVYDVYIRWNGVYIRYTFYAGILEPPNVRRAAMPSQDRASPKTLATFCSLLTLKQVRMGPKQFLIHKRLKMGNVGARATIFRNLSCAWGSIWWYFGIFGPKSQISECCQNQIFKILNDSSHKVYENDTFHEQFHSVVQTLLAFKDHFCAIFVTTTSSLSNEKKMAWSKSAIA